MCQKGGFKLTKFISNSREVLTTIPEERHYEKIKDQYLNIGDLPVERALGVHWNIENDYLGFKINLNDKPVTRRGMLSTISSVYDPLGIAAPFVLEGRKILQKLCQLKVGWDEKIPDNRKKDWVCWRNKLPKLENIKVNRCRVIKYVSILRLELTAATLSIKMSKLIRKELDIKNYEETYWTDSKVILGYINNEVKRFKIFVANMVQTIKENSNVEQWKYISSKDNPADDGSGALDATKVNKVIRWFNGPGLLWKRESEWTISAEFQSPNEEDPEVRKEVTVNATGIEMYNVLDTLEERISCWVKMRRTLAYVKKFICRLREKIKRRNSSNNTDQEYPCVLNVADIQDAEIIIIKLHQRRYFKDEISILIRMRSGEEVTLQRSNKISNLDPFIDENEVLRVGGRVKRSNLNTEYVHPILLSGEAIVTNLLVKWYHQSVGHGGRGYTLNRSLFWSYCFWHCLLIGH